MIKPITTHYNGCKFRSRLEARWAVFFETCGMRWDYDANDTIDFAVFSAKQAFAIEVKPNVDLGYFFDAYSRQWAEMLEIIRFKPIQGVFVMGYPGDETRLFSQWWASEERYSFLKDLSWASILGVNESTVKSAYLSAKHADFEVMEKWKVQP